ncbi:MAG TPA: hypothetical protein VM864_12030 [Pyrinomonadaceae bacterium]|jgi:hypothetical protein|nr:hypothetical protein [Pyrinomonadaceae bacterium]
MQQNRAFRVVKSGQKFGDNRPAERPAADAEREMRTVVSGWIAEHKRAAEELRAASVALLLDASSRFPRAASRA